jgi:hypothetical protein
MTILKDGIQSIATNPQPMSLVTTGGRCKEVIMRCLQKEGVNRRAKNGKSRIRY